nr:hypothetical protein [Saccharolobus solfataricus]
MLEFTLNWTSFREQYKRSKELAKDEDEEDIEKIEEKKNLTPDKIEAELIII